MSSLEAATTLWLYYDCNDINPSGNSWFHSYVFGAGWHVKTLILFDTLLEAHLAGGARNMYKRIPIPLGCRRNGPLDINFIMNHNPDRSVLARVLWLVVNAHYGILFLLINESITQRNNNHKQIDTQVGVALTKYFRRSLHVFTEVVSKFMQHWRPSAMYLIDLFLLVFTDFKL